MRARCDPNERKGDKGFSSDHLPIDWNKEKLRLDKTPSCPQEMRGKEEVHL